MAARGEHVARPILRPGDVGHEPQPMELDCYTYAASASSAGTPPSVLRPVRRENRCGETGPKPPLALVRDLAEVLLAVARRSSLPGIFRTLLAASAKCPLCFIPGVDLSYLAERKPHVLPFAEPYVYIYMRT